MFPLYLTPGTKEKHKPGTKGTWTMRENVFKNYSKLYIMQILRKLSDEGKVEHADKYFKVNTFLIGYLVPKSM